MTANNKQIVCAQCLSFLASEEIQNIIYEFLSEISFKNYTFILIQIFCSGLSYLSQKKSKNEFTAKEGK